MLINQKNNNGGQVPKLAKIFKDIHFNPKTNMWIYIVIFVSLSLSNDRKLF